MPETILGLDPIQAMLMLGVGIVVGWIIGKIIDWFN